MKHLIGKKFKFKSKHGFMDWVGTISDVRSGHFKMVGVGEPILTETVKGPIPVYKDYEAKDTHLILSDKDVIYDLDEIEVLGLQDL
jgi:hypothetical protein